jgi:hypothetical protein
MASVIMVLSAMVLTVGPCWVVRDGPKAATDGLELRVSAEPVMWKTVMSAGDCTTTVTLLSCVQLKLSMMTGTGYGVVESELSGAVSYCERQVTKTGRSW